MRMLFVIGMLFWGGAASAGCLQLEQEATEKVNALGAQMQGLGACGSTRILIQILDINIEFLDQCSESDPLGTTRKGVEDALTQARANENAICS